MVLAMAACSLELLTVVSSARPALGYAALALGKQVWLQTPGKTPVPAALHASPAPKQLRCKVLGLFAFWIMSIVIRFPILRCVIDIHMFKRILSLVWGCAFLFLAFFFSFSSLYKAECDLKLRIDLSVIRPKDVLV